MHIIRVRSYILQFDDNPAAAAAIYVGNIAGRVLRQRGFEIYCILFYVGIQPLQQLWIFFLHIHRIILAAVPVLT